MPDNSATHFIEHVRTVHFALLITSLSLAIASLHNRSSIVKEAARELGIVRDLEDDLKPSNIEHLIRQQVEKEIGGPAPEMDAERSVRLRFKRDDRAPKEITITHPLLGASEGLAECLRQGGTEVGSLAHFASRWDNLNPRPRAPEVYYGGGNLSLKGVLVEGTNETDEANDQSIKPEDFEDGEEVKVETLSTEESNMVAFDIDIVSGKRGSVYLRPSQFHKQAATTVSSDGKHLMVAGTTDESDRYKYQAYVWNLGDPSLKHNFVMDLSRSQTTPVMAISPGALFAAATGLTPPRSGGSVRYWIKVFRPVAGQTVEPLQLLGRAPVAFGEASGQMLYKADSGAGIVLQALPSNAGALTPKKTYLPRLAATALRASADGSWCFAVGNENSSSQTKMGTAYAVNLATGIEEELGKFGSEVGASSISTALDGKTVVVSGELLEDSRAVANSLRVWRVTDGAWKSIGDVSVERKSAIATSPSGKLIAIASAGTIRLLRGLDLSEEKQIQIANADLEEITFGQSEDRLTCILGRGNYSESGYLTKMDDEPLCVAVGNIS